MTTKSPADCGCRRSEGNATLKSQQLGLDELMIVNPTALGVGGLFEGEDGALYQVQGAGEQNEPLGFGQLFLGDDGALYRAEEAKKADPLKSETSNSLGAGEDRDGTLMLGGYLLAADGTLYEITK